MHFKYTLRGLCKQKLQKIRVLFSTRLPTCVYLTIRKYLKLILTNFDMREFLSANFSLIKIGQPALYTKTSFSARDSDPITALGNPQPDRRVRNRTGESPRWRNYPDGQAPHTEASDTRQLWRHWCHSQRSMFSGANTFPITTVFTLLIRQRSRTGNIQAIIAQTHQKYYDARSASSPLTHD
jgi:hypothetical protein